MKLAEKTDYAAIAKLLIQKIKEKINSIPEKGNPHQMSDCLLLLLQITPSNQKIKSNGNEE